MNFRHIDPFDYDIVPLNNAPPLSGSGYGDTFSDKALLATSTREQYGGPSDAQTLALLNAAAGEAAGRSIFQKAAMYQGSKASRKVLGPPLQQWASWSASQQARRETLQIVARPATTPDARYMDQLIPATVEVNLVECGSDCVFVGSWQGHTDTRAPLPSRPEVINTITTRGYAWVQVHPQFSSSVVLDLQTQQYRHDWRNAAIFWLTFVVLYQENPILVSSSPLLATDGQAGVLYGSFPISLPTSIDSLRALPESGLYSPDAANASFAMDMSFWNALSYGSSFTVPGGGDPTPVQTSWGRVLSLFWYPGQSFYIAPN